MKVVRKNTKFFLFIFVPIIVIFALFFLNESIFDVNLSSSEDINSTKKTLSLSDSENKLASLEKSNLFLIYCDKSLNLVFEPIYDNVQPFILQSDIDFSPYISCPTPSFTSISRETLIGLYTNPAKYLTINFKNMHFYLFSYKDSYYYIDNIDDKEDNSYLSSIPFSNLLVTHIDSSSFSDSYSGSGQGVLFTGGSIVDIEWSKTAKDPIEIVDQEGAPISIIHGKTCWILSNESCKIDFK